MILSYGKEIRRPEDLVATIKKEPGLQNWKSIRSRR